LRQTSCVLYIAVDSLIPARGKGVAGFDEFTAALDHAGIPAVWLTNRSRLQFDEPRRKYGHAHPFIAEDGCGVYLPVDYFHLRPDAPGPRSPKKASTVRLGRFTCIPFAQPLPAVAEALEALSEESAVPVVTLGSLSLRELTHNTGLPLREAELARQRDFDALFFFAGTSPEQVTRFLAEGGKRKVQFRQQGALWSVAIGATTQGCIVELSRLYDRALRYHAHTVALATANLAQDLFPFCDRRVLLTDYGTQTASENPSHERVQHRGAREVPLEAPDVWEQVLEIVRAKF
jgi:predicted mannosyl-3-phosphoglycerate phosphatase (HAD superfamily)